MPMQPQPSDFQQRCPKYALEERQPLQQMELEKLDFHLQKSETKSWSLTMQYHQFKMD
jgi:hypothetical protein